ncbi:MAG: class II aldolase/adducin family protein [Elusimicrobiales bacterium]|jgi:L-fuculose-phosphate aldolase
MTEKPERKKIFISDWELRQNSGTAPENAIISPLSLDRLDYGAPAASHRPSAAGRTPGWSVQARTEEELRRSIVEIGRRLYALGFVPATDGNISVRLGDGSILITPSGVSKGALIPDGLAKLDPRGGVISGKKPSSEYRLHLCVYAQRPDVMAVTHAHPPLATGLACSGAALDKPLTSEMVISLGKVPLAGYATPGTEEVTGSIAGLVKEHDAIMLANHGVVTCGRDLETAFQRMETVEQAAKITLAAALAGGGRLIPPDKVKELEEIRRRLGL